MTNIELKDLLSEFTDAEDSIVLEGDEFADGAIGVTEDGHVVYGYNKLAAALAKAWECTYEEAVEWIEYNTIRSLPYMESIGKAPIIIYEFEE